jgi:hypothetical protein
MKIAGFALFGGGDELKKSQKSLNISVVIVWLTPG